MMFEFTTPQLMIIEGNAARTLSIARRAARPAYTRSVYRLVDCPPVAHGLRYVLVGADKAGNATALGIGRAVSSSDTLNLAEIRHRAANLGASEVHVLSDL
jgi:hypothetical protein